MTTPTNEYDILVQRAIDCSHSLAQEQRGGDYAIETDAVKIVYSKTNKSCDVYRKLNDNPVFCRDEQGQVYRIHGEFKHIQPDLERLCRNDET